MSKEVRNIQKVIDLINDGYEIKEIKLSHKEEIGGHSEILLTKNGRINSINGSGKFFFLCSSLESCRQSGLPLNNVYFYLENKKLIQRPEFKNSGHKLLISGYEFSEFSLEDLREDKRSYKKTYATIIIPTDLEDNKNFNFIDFKDIARIYHKDFEKEIFQGYVSEYFYSNEIAILNLRDKTIKSNAKIKGISLKGVTRSECTELILSLGNLAYEKKDMLISLGLRPISEEREFIVIAPIHNLILQKTMQIGTVSFYFSSDDFDDQIIRKNDVSRINEEWNGNLARAKVTVKANNFASAVSLGYKTISCALDILALRENISFPSLTLKKETKFLFNIDKYHAHVHLADWAYCRDLSNPNQSYTIAPLNSINDKELFVEDEPLKYLNGIDKHFERLLKDNLTQEEENIKQALHWLRRAIQTNNKKDCLLDLWTAFEFLISGVQDSPAFSEAEKKKLRKYIRLHKEFSEEQLNILTGAVNNLNFSPLMKKFKFLVKDLGLTFSEFELNLLKISRNKRNSLIHGQKDIELQTPELEKMITIIEKILIAKLIKINITN